MRVTILAALQEEVDAFRGAHELLPVAGPAPFAGHRFRHGASDVLLLRAGVGKACAAMVAQYAVDRERPDCLLVTGIAGGIRPGLALGDVVVSRDCVQHDLDATALGIPLGQVPYTDYRFLSADPRLVALALATPVAGQRVVAGRILTGDQFITAADAAQHRRLRSLEGDVVEMEGAAAPFFVSHTATWDDVRETVRAVERFGREAVKWG
jgi:5'-methylthioadenosine/S-adenosylhomocysteine nucleosidase